MGASTMNLLGAVILVVLGVNFGDEIISASAGILNSTYIDSFLGLNIIGQILPTVYYIAILGLAASVATGVSVKSISGKFGG